MNSREPLKTDEIEKFVTLPVDAYISETYAKDEKQKLWKKTWQVACREEEIQRVGNYYTYDILDQSVIVVRTQSDQIAAFQNVCLHRGRTLTEGCGLAGRFHCKYHGWQWHLDGNIAKVPEREDWCGKLQDDELRLRELKVGRWGGFVFVNFDPECEPLESFLETVPYYLDQFDVGKMRYRWRKWTRVACNWKVAIEAFNEGYHAPTTHPMLSRWGEPTIWSGAQGRHSNLGHYGGAGGGIGTNVAGDENMDPREAALGTALQMKDVCDANTSETIIEAARRLMDVLPPSASPIEVSQKMMEIARSIDAERGVEWPEIDPERYLLAGINWNIFPNTIILPNATFCLGFRVRPDGYDPDSCIFEVFNLERFPEGEEPRPENRYIEDTSIESWGLLLSQDFSNMPFVQKGLKSDGLEVVRPNPFWELSIINFRRALAEYMGYGGPEPIPD